MKTKYASYVELVCECFYLVLAIGRCMSEYIKKDTVRLTNLRCDRRLDSAHSYNCSLCVTGRRYD